MPPTPAGSGARTSVFFSMAEVISRYNAVPAVTIKPMRQSKHSTITVNTRALIKPPSMLTRTMGAVVSTSSSTVVVTPVISPRLFSLKYPIGTLFSRLPMAIRLLAAMKYPGVGLLQLAEIVADSPSQNAGQQQSQQPSGPYVQDALPRSAPAPRNRSRRSAACERPHRGILPLWTYSRCFSPLPQSSIFFSVRSACSITVLCSYMRLPHGAVEQALFQ